MLEFLKGKKSFIGIDFGTSSIKVVELSYKGQSAHLENYGIVDLNLDQAQKAVKNVSYEQKINMALKTLLEKMEIDSGHAYVSIPGFCGLVTIIELPEMEESELAKAIQFEAHKYIPSSLDEIAMSWEVVERAASGNAFNGANQNVGERKIKVLLVAASRRDIDRYDGFVAGTKLGVGAIELETFSIARSLISDDMGNFFIIDIGAQSTNLVLVEKGIVRINRSLDAGGNEVTSAICESMNISRSRAEVFKKGDKDLINGKESAMVVPVLELIVGESQRILNSYYEKNKEAKIDQIILSGGTSQMTGLENYFTTALNRKVTIGNPWRRVTYDEKLAPLIEKTGCSLAVALGLALRGVEEYKRQ